MTQVYGFNAPGFELADYDRLLSVQPTGRPDTTRAAPDWHNSLCSAENACGDYPDDEGVAHGFDVSRRKFQDAWYQLRHLTPSEFNDARADLQAHRDAHITAIRGRSTCVRCHTYYSNLPTHVLEDGVFVVVPPVGNDSPVN